MSTEEKWLGDTEAGVFIGTCSNSTITFSERGVGNGEQIPETSYLIISEYRAPGAKGRPRVWSETKLRLHTLNIVAEYYRRRYRAPTLRQVAEAIDRTVAPMSEEALKKLFQRYGLKWSELKRKTGT